MSQEVMVLLVATHLNTLVLMVKINASYSSSPRIRVHAQATPTEKYYGEKLLKQKRDNYHIFALLHTDDNTAHSMHVGSLDILFRQTVREILDPSRLYYCMAVLFARTLFDGYI
jgi:hypothetical protein